jgi:hypothetical protein
VPVIFIEKKTLQHNSVWLGDGALPWFDLSRLSLSVEGDGGGGLTIVPVVGIVIPLFLEGGRILKFPITNNQ